MVASERGYPGEGLVTEPMPEACDCLIEVTEVKCGNVEYRCDRLSSHTCYGLGWCPLRNTEPQFTPRLRKDGTPKFY